MMKSVFLYTLFWWLMYSATIDVWSSYKMHIIKKEQPFCVQYENKTLDTHELLHTINLRSGIVEDTHARNKWRTFFLDGSDIDKPLDGNYVYLHRNYVTFEEKFALCKGLYSIHSFLFRIKENGKINIEKDGTVLLKETFLFFGIVPIIIEWYGILNQYKIDWYNTKMMYPFGIIDKPSMSEKLRRNPWIILKKQNNIIVFSSGINKYIAYKKYITN